MEFEGEEYSLNAFTHCSFYSLQLFLIEESMKEAKFNEVLIGKDNRWN